LLLLSSTFANETDLKENEPQGGLVATAVNPNPTKDSSPLVLSGVGLALADRTSGSFVNIGLRIVERFYLVGEVGSVHYHNMDFMMNNKTSKLQYDLRTMAIFGRYNFRIHETFGFAAMAGIEKLEGDVILASPRMSSGQKSHVDKTTLVARPMFYHHPRPFGKTGFLLINYGLNIRAIKSFQLATNDLSSEVDTRNEFPNTMTMMPFAAIGAYF